jgi:hypothetical protein
VRLSVGASCVTGENLLLAAFVLMPVVSAGLCRLFFGRLRRQRKKNLSRLLAGNLLVFLLIASVLLLAGESYFRFAYDTTDSFGLSKISRRWFERHWQFNQAQVRDSVDRYPPAVSAGKRRVTFLGDSFTAGHGIADVEDRFANIVRAQRPGWEVHVMAWNGVETGEQMTALTGTARHGYELDVVVLVYCLNDVSDLLPEWKAIYVRLSRPPQAGRFLIDNSYLINTLYYRMRTRWEPDAARYFDFVRDAYTGPIWQLQRFRLQTIREDVRRRGGRLLVVTFPLMHSLGPDYEFADIHRQLELTWREWNAPHLDLLGVYEDMDSADVVVNRYDAHPNERAHRLAADAIVPFIERHMIARPD